MLQLQTLTVSVIMAWRFLPLLLAVALVGWNFKGTGNNRYWIVKDSNLAIYPPYWKVMH
jgi:hypothetical protein